jgi:predicted transcriptional regulator of viral defense system
LWWIDGDPDPNRVAELLVAPYPAYLSLHSALRIHDMIEQIPVVTYVVSLARSQRVRTSAGAYSFHHIRPELFVGYQQRAHFKVATPEKALFDLAYLAGGRSRLRAGVPELELPKRFRHRDLRRFVALIPSSRGRTLVEQRLEKILDSRVDHRAAR